MSDDSRFTKLRATFVDVFESNEAQADIGAGALYQLTEMKAGKLFLNGKPIDSADTLAWVRTNYAFLLPPKAEEKPKAITVDAATLASATAGNLTALGRLARDVGADKARELVATELKKSVTDNRDTKDAHHANPWSKSGWSLARQGAVVRAMGLERAGGVAASVNSRVGATKPVQ